MKRPQLVPHPDGPPGAKWKVVGPPSLVSAGRYMRVDVRPGGGQRNVTVGEVSEPFTRNGETVVYGYPAQDVVREVAS